MRLISWNVNGIRAVHKKGALDWLWEERPDAICLQETKAWPGQLKRELLEPPGYRSFWDQAERKGYSGTCIYAKSGMKPLDSGTGIGVEEFDREGRTTWVEFENFVLYNIYFPNGLQSQERLKFKLGFYDAFLEHIDGLRKRGKKIIWTGDLNTAHKPIDLARPKENENRSGFLPIEREWIDKCVEHGYIDTFRRFHAGPDNYTWWDYKTRARERNVGWRLDYFWVSEDLLANLKDAFIRADILGSDHCPVGIDIEF